MENLLGLKNQTEYKMDSDLTRRIRNFNLSPDQYLMPLFEAISNSIHAIQDKFGPKWTQKGRIKVEITRDEENVQKVVITDNGIGLDDYNFDSFLKTDSDYKSGKGGKGIGRFSWLVCFNEIKITSCFKRDNSVFCRSFDFAPRESPVYNHNSTEISAETGTRVELSGVKHIFVEKYKNSNISGIAKESIKHFLPTILAGIPDILFIDGEEEINIKDLWKDIVVETKTEQLNSILNISITHILIRSGVAEKNALYFSANYRTVNHKDLSKLLGLKNALIYRKEEKSDPIICHYIGVLSSELFDRASYSERTGLSISDDLMGQIVSEAVMLLKTGFLKSFYEQIMSEKSQKLHKLIEDNPKFSYLIKNNSDLEKFLNSSSSTNLEFYKDLSVADYEENRRITEKMQEVIDKTNKGEDISIEEVAAEATQKNQSALAQYVKERKDILDLLETRRGWKDSTTRTRYLESDIHSVICPLKTDSDELSIDKHNLWVLDDRLAYYEYFASDKQIKSYLTESDSEKRPDIALFKGCNAFQREFSNQPVVIVEFKRPERDDYTEQENPIVQVFNYIKDFKDKKVRKSGGQVITTINDQTAFQCYIVCDITPKMIEYMNNYGSFTAYPDGHGYRSYRKEYNAMIDIIPFENLITDARLRNEIFFDKLGLIKK